jgi:hypothetical protein
MIISHANKFIFFKPMKVAGSSIEVGLINSCGKNDLVTGGSHVEELNSSLHDYRPRNNQRKVRLTGEDAKNYLTSLKELGLLNSPPMTEKEINRIKEIECDTTIFTAHATPKQFLERIENKEYLDCREYHKITVVRNPWDQMVSFFWWSFGQPESALPAFRKIMAHAESLPEWARNIKPLPSDSVDEIKIKFETFLSRRGDNLGPFGIVEDVQTAKWFGETNSEYYDHPIDTVMRFENLNKDYTKLCDKLNIENIPLPSLKGTVKKKKLHFSKYYTPDSVKLVSQSFAPVIEKFGYNFEEK